MAVRFTRPSSEQLRLLAERAATDTLTYDPIGLTASTQAPPGYRLDRWSRSLGHGPEVFERASDALRDWRVHRGAGLVVAAIGPPARGSNVAMAAPLPLGFVEVVCRVVDVVDEPDRYGFAYGTLSIHPEQGEESFTVVRTMDDSVTFEIVAVSRHRQLIARAVPPIARRLQLAATNRYLQAMQAAIGG